jgi:phosphohistidine phosphatase
VAKRLLVLRHGHAERQAPPGGSDFDRTLRPKGRRSVAALAPVVRGLAVDLVLCSPSVRTSETLAGLGLTAPADYPDALYGAAAPEWIEAVREVGADDRNVSCLLVVGHNPGLHELVLELTGGERIPGFPPAALAVLDLDIDDWWELAAGGARLERLHLPDDPSE